MAEQQTANVALRDAMIRHQINLQRVSSGIVKQIHEVLNATEQDIAAQIRGRLAASSGLDSPADVARMQGLLDRLEALRTTTWETLDEVWEKQIMAIAVAEPKFLANQLDTTSPVVLDLSMPALATLKAIVKSTPFEGRTLEGWAQTIADQDIRRMEAQIRLGMTAGEDSATIARRVVGSARMAGTDGVTQITRRNAEAITRTAVNFIANLARRKFIMDNAEVFSEEMFLAVLDSRTTPICRSLDGDLYEVGKGPIPPLHFGCRSTRVPVLDGQAIGNRPFKASTEKQLLREFAAANSLEKVPTSRADLPHGTKGRFDAWARGRVNELTGQVPASVNYQEWLSGQSKAFQDDVLGPTRAKLFRDGDLTLDKFVNRQGDELTLAELASRQAEAFRAAGLDPGAF